MRGLAALVAGLAGWTLARGALPRVRLPVLPRVTAGAALAAVAAGSVAAVLALGLTDAPAVAAATGILAGCRAALALCRPKRQPARRARRRLARLPGSTPKPPFGR